MTPDEARAAAAKAFGNPSRAARAVLRIQPLDPGSSSSCRTSATRGARCARSPAFLVTTVLTLAIGLGLLTVAFTVFNAYVAAAVRGRRSGAASTDRLARVRRGRRADFAGATTTNSRERTRPVRRRRSPTARGSSRRRGGTLSAAFVSANYFDALAAANAARPRASAPARRRRRWRCWATRRGRGCSRAIRPCSGASSISTGARVTVVGVARPEFAGLDEFPRDLWVPLADRAARARSPRAPDGVTSACGRAAAHAGGGRASRRGGALAPPRKRARRARVLTERHGQPAVARAARGPVAGLRGVRAGAGRPPASTSRTSCWRARSRAIARSPCGSRSAPAAAASCGSCSPKGCSSPCWPAPRRSRWPRGRCVPATSLLFSTLPPSLGGAAAGRADDLRRARLRCSRLPRGARRRCCSRCCRRCRPRGMPLTDALRGQRSGTRAARGCAARWSSARWRCRSCWW